MPRLFERFHRVEGQKSRTFEGSGIGLALVQELVKLHGGTISVESQMDRGTTFRVSIPCGHAHLPAERIGAGRSPSISIRADAYVQEALRWLPDGAPFVENPREIDAPGGTRQLKDRARILVADDNSDMRDYLRRLLEGLCEVEAVADGEAALQAIRARRPDLVIADVMMPRRDGFGLIQAIRGDPELLELPIIILSARAGEESRVKGLQSGADDYLVKPFSARELIARVSAHLGLSRVRREVAEGLRRRQAWLAGEAQAFQAAMNGAPLERCLDILIRTVVQQADDGRRCAFYIANPDGTALHHVVGMTEIYAREVDGLKIGPDSFACGLAAHEGQPVITRDVTLEPRWRPWLWLAREYG
ncbi:MAG: response regulator, partial [Bradyrhizobium sp.]